MPEDNRVPTAAERERIPRISSHYRLQWEPAQQAFVLLYPEGMVRLNASAGEILSRCDGSRSVDTIITGLAAEFPEAEGLADDVLEFLRDAENQRWLEYE